MNAEYSLTTVNLSYPHFILSRRIWNIEHILSWRKRIAYIHHLLIYLVHVTWRIVFHATRWYNQWIYKKFDIFRFVIRIFQRTVFPDDIVKAQLWEKSQHTRRDSVHSVDTQDTGDIISDQEARRNGQQSAETDIRIRNCGTTKTSTTIA